MIFNNLLSAIIYNMYKHALLTYAMDAGPRPSGSTGTGNEQILI